MPTSNIKKIILTVIILAIFPTTCHQESQTPSNCIEQPEKFRNPDDRRRYCGQEFAKTADGIIGVRKQGVFYELIDFRESGEKNI